MHAARSRTYQAAIQCLNTLQTNAANLDQVRKGKLLNNQSLPQMASFLRRIGHSVPELNALHVIHIAGTKGKGSTAAFVDSILRQVRVPPAASASSSPPQPLKSGLFTSPHLVHVNERIRIDGRPLARERFAEYFFQVWDRLEATRAEREHPEWPEMPTYFRFLNLLSFHIFLCERVHVCVCEVGVGGEYDSTNVLQGPVVCGITALGLDHQQVLGATLAQIAWHKAGIMKPGVPCFTVPQPPSAQSVLAERAAERGCGLVVVHEDEGDLPPGVVLGLEGAFQRGNAALAVRLARCWAERRGIALPPSAISCGLEQAKWPGRAQRLHAPATPGITWFLDGAHTPESMGVCATWFGEAVTQAAPSASTPRILLFNCTHGRDGDTLLPPLVSLHHAHPFDAVYFCTNDTSSPLHADTVNYNDPVDRDAAGRLAGQEALATCWRALVPGAQAHVLASIPEAIATVTARHAGAQVLVTGSLYLVGGVLGLLDPRFADCPC